MLELFFLPFCWGTGLFNSLGDEILSTENILFQPVTMSGSSLEGQTINMVIGFKKPTDGPSKPCGNRGLNEADFEINILFYLKIFENIL